MKVVFSPQVENYLFNLIEVLYDKEYFGFKNSAINYVTELIQNIQKDLHTSPKKIAPKYFNKYGDNLYYTSFRLNKSTQWFVFFSTYIDDEELIYMVSYISNNHSIASIL